MALSNTSVELFQRIFSSASFFQLEVVIAAV